MYLREVHQTSAISEDPSSADRHDYGTSETEGSDEIFEIEDMHAPFPAPKVKMSQSQPEPQAVEATPPIEEYKRHFVLWYPDGNVLLSAVSRPRELAWESDWGSDMGEEKDDERVDAEPSGGAGTNGRVVVVQTGLDKTVRIFFRLHKSLLSQNSNAFKELFADASVHGEDLLDPAVAQALDEGGADKGCDRLPCIRLSDTAEEIETLLNVIYIPL